MCSELFRIPLEIAGIPLFGGVLMVAWLIICGMGLVTTARQENWRAAAVAHVPTMLIGVAMLLFLPRYFPDGVPVRGYGVMLIVGCTAAIALAMHRARQVGLDPEEIIRLAVWMFVAGIVGGRVFYVVEYWSERFRIVNPSSGAVDWTATLKACLTFTEGGLVVYGAFLGAMAAFMIHMARRRLPALAMADLIAPSMVVALAFGRIGCLLNGCCYGGESEVPWAVTFPGGPGSKQISPPYADQAQNGRFQGFRIGPADDGSSAVVVKQVDAESPAATAGLEVGDRITMINGTTVSSVEHAQQLLFDAVLGQKGRDADATLRLQLNSGEVKEIAAGERPSRSLPVHPTQIYSAVNAALLAWLLWSFYPWRRHDGEVLALLLSLYPIARFLLEIIRVDENAVFGTRWSISQNISIVVFLSSLAFWFWLRRRPRRREVIASFSTCSAS